MTALSAALVALGLAVLHAITIGVNAWIAQYQLNAQTKDIAAAQNDALDKQTKDIAAKHTEALDKMGATLVNQQAAKKPKKGE